MRIDVHYVNGARGRFDHVGAGVIVGGVYMCRCENDDTHRVLIPIANACSIEEYHTMSEHREEHEARLRPQEGSE